MNENTTKNKDYAITLLWKNRLLRNKSTILTLLRDFVQISKKIFANGVRQMVFTKDCYLKTKRLATFLKRLCCY